MDTTTKVLNKNYLHWDTDPSSVYGVIDFPVVEYANRAISTQFESDKINLFAETNTVHLNKRTILCTEKKQLIHKKNKNKIKK